MECKKCGATIDDNAIYCGNCGTRVDGKKVCKRCGKENEEYSKYCVYCGKALDETLEKKDKKIKTLNIFRTLSNFFALFGALVALVFVFFIKFNPQILGASVDIDSISIFDFFEKVFNYENLQNAETVFERKISSAFINAYGFTGLALAIISILWVVISFVLATAKILDATINNKPVVFNVFLYTISGFLFGVFALFALVRESINGVGGYNFNVMTMVGVIVCFISLFLCFIFKFLEKGEKLKANVIIKVCVGVACAIFAVLTIVFVSRCCVLFERSSSYSFKMELGFIKFSSAQEILAIAESLGDNNGAYIDSIERAFASGVITQILITICILFTCISLVEKVLFTIGSSKGNGLVLDSFSTVFSVIVIVFSNLCIEKYNSAFALSDLSNIVCSVSSSGWIVTLVFAVIMFSLSIVQIVYKHKTEGKVLQQKA